MRKGFTLVEIYNSVPTIPMLDPIIHTDEQPECDDPDCPCHTYIDPWADAYEQVRERDRHSWDPADETGTHPPNCRCGWCEPAESRW